MPTDLRVMCEASQSFLNLVSPKPTSMPPKKLKAHKRYMSTMERKLQSEERKHETHINRGIEVDEAINCKISFATNSVHIWANIVRIGFSNLDENVR